MVSDELLRAFADDGSSLRLRPLPARAVALLTELGAPARLAAHLRAVHDVAAQLVSWLGEQYPQASVDESSVLMAAALHDIGKVLHRHELSGPGSSHEDGGYQLLKARHVDEHVAQLVRDHGSWQRPDASLELLLVSLADAVWKDKRRDDLEQLVVDHIAAAARQPPWSVFANLDEHLTAVGGKAVQRLAYQNQYGTQ